MRIYPVKVLVSGVAVSFFMAFALIVIGEAAFVDYTSPEIKVILKRQRAIEERDYLVWWEGCDSLTKQVLFDNSIEKFKKWASERFLGRESVLKVQLKGAERITPNRAWISAFSSTHPRIKGYYLIKERGEWKVAFLQAYMRKIKRDMGHLKGTIIRYFEAKGRLPTSLRELVPGYINELPKDPFNEKGDSYIYATGIDVKLYSFGPDSDDDYGAVVYNPKKGPVSNGDIITLIELD